MRKFVSAATGVSQALIAVTLTGLAILVSFSDREFLTYFLNVGGFEKLLFIFEYTVLFALLTSLSGVILQSVEFERWVFFIFLFIFLHLLASVAALVSTILEYATKKADYERISSIDEKEVPEALTEDIQEIIDNNDDSPESDQDSEVP